MDKVAREQWDSRQDIEVGEERIRATVPLCVCGMAVHGAERRRGNVQTCFTISIKYNSRDT